MSKKTTTEEKVVVTGAIVAGLLFFGLVTKTCQNPLDRSLDTAASTPSADHSEYQTKIDELEGQLETLQDNSLDEEKISDLEAQLSDQSLQLSQNLKASEEQVSDLEARLEELSGMSTAEAADNTQITELTSKLELSESDRQELTTELSTMSAAAASKSDKLAEQVKILSTDNKKLSDQLAKAMAPLKATPNVDKDTAGKMNRLLETSKAQKLQITEQNGQIANLSAQINKLKAAKNVFVESVDDLPEKAKGLFADLNTLEGKPEEEVQAAYAQYLTKHGATAKKRIKFASGTSSVTENDKREIAALTQQADKNSYFFIVGYADQSGSAAGNKKLSSARSTSVAKELARSAQGLQSAQAVYLGQTNRFGPSAENRVVEIWEIK